MRPEADTSRPGHPPSAGATVPVRPCGSPLANSLSRTGSGRPGAQPLRTRGRCAPGRGEGAGLPWGPTAPRWGLSVGVGLSTQAPTSVSRAAPTPAPFICSAEHFTDSDSFPSHGLEVTGSTLWEGSPATLLIKTFGWATH